MSISFIDYAIQALKQAEEPLTYQEMWALGTKLGLNSQLKTKGKTPRATLGARLYVEVRDNSNDSPIVKIGQSPARFFLRSRCNELPNDYLDHLAQKEEAEVKQIQSTKSSYIERDLHPLLAYFAASHPEFNRGRSVYTKTIFHEESSKSSGYNKWVHPDMVGFYLPDWNSDIIDLNMMTDNNALRLFSFELKKSINKGNYREVYFQAVSNSSWAHEGFLVAADIQGDDGLLLELNRLVLSFGIGIIRLNLSDIDTSTVLYPARPREFVDWEMVQKLFQQNDGFRRFIADVRIDYSSKKIHPSEYDKVMGEKELDGYLTSLLKGKR